ncbi:MAG: MFS transporter [Fimbriimonadaceae bacterium]|nr:MFS transporter [Fimbriimonadaceae bacterium]
MDGVRLYPRLRFWQAFAAALMGTYFVVHQIKTGGMSPLQLTLIGTAMEIGIFLFEIPTGAVADAVSRRTSVLIGLTLTGLCFLAMGMLPVFWAFLAFSLIWGIGQTFISGAREAWAADEIAHSSEPDLAPTALFVRGSKAEFLGAFLGPLAAAGLSLLGLGVPVTAGGAAMILLALILWRIMPETGFRRVEGRYGARDVLQSLRDGWRHVRGRAALVAALVVTLFLGISSEGFDRLWQKHILDRFTLPTVGPVSGDLWWAVLASTMMLLSYLVATLVQRHVRLGDERQILAVLAWMTAGLIAALLVLIFAPSFWVAAAAYLVCRTLRKANSPLLTGWINAHAPAHARATVLSFEGQAHSLGEIGGGPAAGGLAQAFRDVRAGLMLSAVLLLPALGSLLRRRAQTDIREGV